MGAEEKERLSQGFVGHPGSAKSIEVVTHLRRGRALKHYGDADYSEHDPIYTGSVRGREVGRHCDFQRSSGPIQFQLVRGRPT